MEENEKKREEADIEAEKERGGVGRDTEDGRVREVENVRVGKVYLSEKSGICYLIFLIPGFIDQVHHGNIMLFLPTLWADAKLSAAADFPTMNAKSQRCLMLRNDEVRVSQSPYK